MTKINKLRVPADQEHKGPGRPRCPVTHQNILDAAMMLAGREDYADISMDLIASSARVGKQTLYRWWPSKADLMLEAYAGRSRIAAPLPTPSGDAIGDLTALFRNFMVMLRDPHNQRVIRALVAEAQLDDAFRARFYSHLVERRRAATREILHHGIARGRIRADLDLELAIDLMYGPTWYWLLSGKPAGFTLDDANALIDALAPWMTGAGAPAARPPAPTVEPKHDVDTWLEP